MTDQPNARALEADVLLWIARLPLVPTGDLELLTGASRDAVRHALDALRRHGWTERVLLRPPGYEQEFEGHALRDIAIPAFARAFGLDEGEVRRHWPVERRDLLDRITTFDIADAVNNALVRIAARCREEVKVEVVDFRVLPRRRYAGCWWPADAQAYGRVYIGSEEAHFLLVWDRVGTSATERSARVRGWYDACVVWNDSIPPSTLLICPSLEQEQGWDSALRAEAKRREDEACEADPDDFDPDDYEPLEIAVVRPQDVGGEYCLDRWRRPGDTEPMSLFEVLGRYSSPSPLTPPSAPRLDLIDRGVDIEAPSLREWASQLLVSGQGNARERVAAQMLMLGPAHREMLVHLARHPYLTDGELASTLGETDEQTRHLLADLDRYGLTGFLTKEQP